MTKNPEDDEPVGYGHPPVHSRFQKGRSGNPAGRPRNKASTIFESLLDEKVTLEDGSTSTKLEQLLAGMVRKAPTEPEYMRMVLGELRRLDRLEQRAEAYAARAVEDSSDPSGNENGEPA